MTDPIRAALDKARAVYCHADGECPCATPDDCPMKVRSEVPAKIIAAFLRALPEGYVEVQQPERMTRQLGMNHIHARAVADAVIAAAKEDQK